VSELEKAGRRLVAKRSGMARIKIGTHVFFPDVKMTIHSSSNVLSIIAMDADMKGEWCVGSGVVKVISIQVPWLGLSNGLVCCMWRSLTSGVVVMVFSGRPSFSTFQVTVMNSTGCDYPGKPASRRSSKEDSELATLM